MNTQLKKLATFSAAIVAVVVLSFTSPVYAQRDSGAKARGDMNSFWSPKYQSRSYCSGVVQTRESFSYEPAEAVTGADNAVSEAAPTERSAVQPQIVERRSFSYEPSYRSNRSYSAPKKQPWQYQKTDPRRYRTGG